MRQSIDPGRNLPEGIVKEHRLPRVGQVFSGSQRRRIRFALVGPSPILLIALPERRRLMAYPSVSVLVLTQFFPPEGGAAQNRLGALVRELSAAGAKVTIITAMPNYPTRRVFDGYRGRFFLREQYGAATVLRSWSWVHTRRSIVLRGLSFVSFGLSSLIVGVVYTRGIDIVLWESPPLPLGLTAWLLAKLRRAALVTNVSDLWTESLLDLQMLKPGLLSRLFERIERFLYRASRLVSGQTRYILSSVEKACPTARACFWPNGADLQNGTAAVSTAADISKRARPERFVVGYAGLMGHSQGLETVIAVAKVLRDESVQFVFVGDGPERIPLIEAAAKLNLNNILWKPQVPHRDMPEVWRSFDCALVCLRGGKVFRGAVPSKLYEAMGAGLPILLAIEGEAEAIVRDVDCGIVVKPDAPEDWARAIRHLRGSESERLRLGGNGRRAAAEKYDRAVLTRQYAEAVLALVKGGSGSTA